MIQGWRKPKREEWFPVFAREIHVHELFRTGCRFFVETKRRSRGTLVLFAFFLAFAGLSFQGCSKESGTPKGEARQKLADGPQVTQCASSQVGTLGCQCLGGPGGNCQPGYVCQEGVCIEPLQCEPPGILNCICNDSLPCGAGLRCDSGSCASCGANRIGCSCMNHADCGSAAMKCKQKVDPAAAKALQKSIYAFYTAYTGKEPKLHEGE